MASHMFENKSLDVHAGGIDLAFPHHNNELAQADAAAATAGGAPTSPWVHHFWHAGHLMIDGLKMSKSLKNFITVRDALKTYTPRQIRLFFLIYPWQSSITYSTETMGKAVDLDRKFHEFFANVESRSRGKTVENTPQKWTEAEWTLQRALQGAQTRSHAYLVDNFDYVGALNELVTLISTFNVYLVPAARSHTLPSNFPLVREVASFVRKTLFLFGVEFLTAASATSVANATSAASAASGELDSKAVVNAAVEFRSRVRTMALANPMMESKQVMQLCDEFRNDKFAKLGIRIEDLRDGSSTWKPPEDPALVENKEERRQQKTEQKMKQQKQELARWMRAQLSLSEYFAAQAKYGSYDVYGIPLTMVDGAPLSKSAQKLVKKEAEQHARLKSTLAEKLAKDPLFLDRLR